MVMKRMEKAFGLPNLQEVQQTLNAVNTIVQQLDEKKLDKINHLVTTLAKMQSQSGPEGLHAIEGLVQGLTIMSDAKLDKIMAITHDISDTAQAVQKIIKNIDPELLKSIPIKDIAAEIKKAMVAG